MKRINRFLIVSLVLLAGILSSSLTAFAKEKTYRIGTDLEFAPFEYANTKGEYIGIDIEVMKRIAEICGFQIEISPVGFDAAVQAVQAGQLDAMIAGMTITDERKKNFEFSEPYFESGIQMAAHATNDSIQSYDDLNGKTVGAKVGTESAEFLENNKEKYGYSVVVYDNSSTLYDALNTTVIDAIVDDYPILGYAIVQGKELRTVGEPVKGGAYGFAVKKGNNEELITKFNEGLKTLVDSGEYDEIVGRYIASDGSSTGTSEQDGDKVDESTFAGLVSNNYKGLLKGLWYTLCLSFISLLFAFFIGVFFGLSSVSNSRVLRIIATIYVDVIRGIPLLVLAYFIYLGIPNLTGVKLDIWIAGGITLSLNAGAYISEIVRGGILAIPKGQIEASRSLGLTYATTMRKIVLPQAVKIMIPSFINQFVITLKDTTILSAIGIVELLQSAKIIVARNLESFKVYFIISIMYLVVITVLTKLSKLFERRMHKNGK